MKLMPSFLTIYPLNLVPLDTGLKTEETWSRFWNPASLECEPVSNEVYIQRTDGIIRRIISNQAVIAIDPVPGESAYTIRCFSTLQLDGSDSDGFPKCFGSPYVTYKFRRGATDTSLVIERSFRSVTDLRDSNVPVSYADWMSYQRTDTYPKFTWVKIDWTKQGAAAVTETRIISSGDDLDPITKLGERKESITINPPGGVAQFKLTRVYRVDSYGEWLIRELLNDDPNLQSTFDYHADATNGQS